MRDVQSSVLRMLHSYGIPADIIEEYDCVPVRIRRVGDTVKLQTMFGARAVKAVSEPPANVQNAFTVTEYLAGKGVPRIPRFIRNRYGDAFVRDGNRFYYMTDWIGGRALEVRHPEHMMQAVEELAAWHIAAKGALGNSDGQVPAYAFLGKLQKLYDGAAVFWKNIREKTDRTEFERLFAGFAQDVLLRTGEAMDRLSALDFADYEKQMCEDGWVCHGNFSAAHIRYDGESYSIVDYDTVGLGTPLFDLVYFMNTHMTEHGWNTDLTEKLTATYVHNAGAEDWRPYISAMLWAPLDILQLVEAYQLQDFKDEGVFTDVLENSLELLDVKGSALGRLSREEPVLSVDDTELAENSDEVVHADLQAQAEDSSAVAAKVAKLETNSESEQTKTKKSTKRQNKPANKKKDQDTDQIRVRKYRPKSPQRSSSIQGNTDKSTGARLWGDAQHPGE